jgi:hypothetical protein
VKFSSRHVPREVRNPKRCGRIGGVVNPDLLPRRGPAPYGWRRTARGELAPVEEEQAVRWLILHMSRQGFPLTRIAGELLTLHIPTRDGGETWPKATLHRIVATARDLDRRQELARRRELENTA